MREQALDVRAAIQLIRRSWRVVLAFVVIGVAAAAAHELSAPKSFQAEALVLLPPSNASAAGTTGTNQTAATEARIATSAAVLAPAAHQVDPTLPLGTVQRDVSASSNTTNVLTVTARGATRHRAIALANAVARQLVEFLVTNGSQTNSSVVVGLRAEANQLSSEIHNVQGQLAAADQRVAADGATSSARQQDTALVDQLTAEKASLSLQLNTVQSQITQVSVDGVGADAGTRVLQRATSAAPPSVVALAFPLALAVIGGVLVGGIVVLVWHRRDRRLWSRDAVAEAVGAPVVLALDAPIRRSVRQWVELLRDHRTSSFEQWSLRRALREMGIAPSEGRSVRVLVMASDAGGMALAIELAVGSATSGMRTHLSVVGEDQHIASLRTACARFVEGGGPRTSLTIVDPHARSSQGRPDLSVTVIGVDEHWSNVSLGGSTGTVTVLAVSSGFASGEQLAALAIAAADRGTPVAFVLVANPAAGDQTVGRFPGSGVQTVQSPPRRRNGTASAVPSRRAR